MTATSATEKRRHLTIARLDKYEDDALLARWHRIIEIVRDELTRLNLQRQFMQEATDIVNANPHFLAHAGRQFMDFIRDWYGTAMALAYRRQTDPNPKSASLRVLLEEMAVRPGAYKIEALRPFMGSATDEVIREFVMDSVCGANMSGIDPNIVNADIRSLAATGKKVQNFVNKHLAHTDILASTEPFSTTFNEIHAAAITCEKIASRWVAAITGASCRFDVVTQFGWHDLFDFPWRALRPDEDAGTRRYVVTEHPCLDEAEEESIFMGRSNEQRKAFKTNQILEIIADAQSLKPFEHGTVTAVPPNLYSVQRII